MGFASSDSHAVQEAQAESKLVQLMCENGTSDLEDGKLVRGTEDAQVPFDFFARS